MLQVYFNNLKFFQVLKTLKFASVAITFTLNIVAADNKPPIILSEDSQHTKRYSCLTERYRDVGALFSDQCKESQRPYWLLSLDGGGVRAFMHLLSIDRIENITNTPISELVDGISGTSAGGVLACLLTMKDPRTMRPKYFAKDLLDAMVPTRDQMFIKRWSSLWGVLGPRYRSRPLERYLGNFFGDDKFQLRSVPVVVVTHDLSSYSERLIASTDSSNYLTRDVAMAALSAPTFFSPKVLRSISIPSESHLLMDGATVMDNPVLAGISLLQETYGVHLKHINVLSFGTGTSAATHNSEVLINSGFFGWGKKIIPICREGQLSTIDNLAKFYLKDRYHRFQPVLGEGNMHLIDTSDEYLAITKAAQLKMLKDRNDEMIRIAAQLSEVAKVKEAQHPKAIKTPPVQVTFTKRGFSTMAASYFTPKNLQTIRRFIFRK